MKATNYGDNRGTFGWNLLLRYKVAQLQKILSQKRLKREMSTKQLEPFFAVLLAPPSEDCDLESLHLLLSNLMRARSLSQSLDNSLCLYLASRLRHAEVRTALSDRASDLSFLFKSTAWHGVQSLMTALETLPQNVISEQALATYLEKGLALV